jgi:hypothetical protein
MRSFAKSFTKTLARFAPAAILIFAPMGFAADKADPAFAKWWQKFQISVMRNDIRSIDKGAEFPMDWQISEDVRAIRGESDFAANFGLFFTTDVKKNVAAGKPEKLPNGNYVLVWKTGGKGYSLNFRFYNNTYVMDSLVDDAPKK